MVHPPLARIPFTVDRGWTCQNTKQQETKSKTLSEEVQPGQMIFVVGLHRFSSRKATRQAIEFYLEFHVGLLAKGILCTCLLHV